MNQFTAVVVAAAVAAALRSVGAQTQELVDHDCVLDADFPGYDSCADIADLCTDAEDTYAHLFRYFCPITCNNTGNFTIEDYSRDTPEPFRPVGYTGSVTCAQVTHVFGCSLASNRLFCPCTCNTPFCNNASICQEWVPAPSNCSGTASTVLLNSNEVSYPDTDQYFDVGTQSRDFFLHSPFDVRVAILSRKFIHYTSGTFDLLDSIEDIPANTLVKLTVKLDTFNLNPDNDHTGQLAITEVECGYNVAELDLHYCPSKCAKASSTATTTTLTTITAFAPGAQCNCGNTPAPQAPPRPDEEKAWDRTLVVLASVVIVATVASVVASLRNKGYAAPREDKQSFTPGSNIKVSSEFPRAK